MTDKRNGFDKHAMRIANNLRRMADEIELEISRDDPVDESAQEIIHTVTWGVANLQLGLLLRWTVRVINQDKNDGNL